MSKLNIDELARFVSKGEKAPPPVFIGRENILTDIEKAAALRFKDNNADGAPGNTRVVQGAPGAGKSSLIFEIKRNLNWQNNLKDAENLRIPQVVELEVAEVVDGTTMLRKLAEAVDVTKANDISKRTTRVNQIEGSVGIFGLGAKAGASKSTEDGESSALMSVFKEWLKEIEKEELDTPIIIAIDEAQNLPTGLERPSNLFLQSVHNNRSRLPISLLLAGLGDTENTVNKFGLTHGLTVHSLGRFARAESIELIQKWCAHFGIAIGSQMHRLKAYCQLADDWPRHLHCAHQALGKVVLNLHRRQPDFNGSLDLLRDQDWLQVTSQFAQHRAEYYRGRTNQDMSGRGTLISSLMKELDNHTTMEEILDKMVIETASSPRPLNSVAATELFNHLVHQGALQEIEPNGPVICPIPSFRTWLIESRQYFTNAPIYSLRYGDDVYNEEPFDNLKDAHNWAIKQSGALGKDREISLWQGPLKVEILSDRVGF